MEACDTPHGVLRLARASGIRLWVEADRLRYDGPRGALTPELRARLREHRTALMTFLREEPQGPHSALPPAETRRLPPSFAQERFWQYQKASPADPFFNVPLGFHLAGGLDAAALAESFNATIRRHELLRTTLEEVSGTLAQVVAPAATIELPVADLRGWSEEAQSGEIGRLTREDVRRPFDLSRDPVLRARLIRLEQDRHILLLCLYRYVVEDRSLSVLLKELSRHYAAFAAGEASAPARLPMQYADYAQWERQALKPDGIERALQYWSKWWARGDPPPWSLPAARRLPEVQTFRAGKLAYSLPCDLTLALKTLGQRTGTTLFMAVLALYAALLSRLSLCTDLVVGVPFANRNHWMLEPLIGTIGDIMALRLDLGGDPDFTALLARVRSLVLDTLRHQELPFEQVARRLRPDRPGKAPLFKVVLSFLMEAPGEQLRLPGLAATPIETGEAYMRPDLTLVAWEETLPAGSVLRGYWQYKKDLFDEETVARMSEGFLCLCSAVASRPDQPLTALPLAR